MSDDPLISSKLAAVDQTNPLSISDTALSTLAGEAQSGEVLAALAALLPELDTTAAGLTVVTWAVALRAVYCLYSRVVNSRRLERSLPHSEWYYRKHVELAFWKDKRNYEKAEDVQSVVDQYSSDHGLIGGPHKVRKRTAWTGIALSYVNVCGLYLFSQAYATQLAEAPFLWVPNLLQPDPLYILPAVNVALSVFLFRLIRQGIIYPVKMPKSRSITLRESFGESKTMAVMLVSLSALVGGKLFFLASDQIQSLYLLFWTSSNITGLLITLTVMKSNLARKQVQLLPKQEFTLLMAKNDIALDPEVIEAEKRKMNEREEEILDKSKQASLD